MLLHGTPFSSFIWRGIARALARTHQVYVWDMPGYGAPETVHGQDLSLAAWGAVFADSLQHWELTDPTWWPTTLHSAQQSRHTVR